MVSTTIVSINMWPNQKCKENFFCMDIIGEIYDDEANVVPLEVIHP